MRLEKFVWQNQPPIEIIPLSDDIPIEITLKILFRLKSLVRFLLFKFPFLLKLL